MRPPCMLSGSTNEGADFPQPCNCGCCVTGVLSRICTTKTTKDNLMPREIHLCLHMKHGYICVDGDNEEFLLMAQSLCGQNTGACRRRLRDESDTIVWAAEM